MKRLVLSLIALTLWGPLSAQTVLTGKTEAEILAEKGKPISKTAAGTRAIYRWDDSVITFENGKVVRIEARDPAREKQAQSESLRLAAKRKALADTKAKQAKAINDQYQADSRAEQARLALEESEQRDEKRKAEMREQNEKRLQREDANIAQSYSQSRADAAIRDREIARQNAEASKPPVVKQTRTP